MLPKRSQLEQPFPLECPHCASTSIALTEIDYLTQVKHEGRLERFHVRDLRIPICALCGEKIFTEEVDRQINQALREHLKLLSPEEIRSSIEQLGMSQKEVAQALGVAEGRFRDGLTRR